MRMLIPDAAATSCGSGGRLPARAQPTAAFARPPTPISAPAQAIINSSQCFVPAHMMLSASNRSSTYSIFGGCSMSNITSSVVCAAAPRQTTGAPMGRPEVTAKAVAAPSKGKAGKAGRPLSAPPNGKQLDFDIPRGDTAGAAMVLEGLTVQAGDRDLLEEVDWRLLPGQRVGLVGANGAGKSTLLKCLCGTRKVDAGRILIGPKVEVGYLEQTAVSGSQLTVWQEARSRMTALITAEHDLEVASKAAEAGVAGALEQLQKAQEAFEAAGGYDVDKRIANVLSGLGFRQDQWHKLCSEFSGGWQMRIALARLLLGPAGQSAVSGVSGGLLLLDEPTNHLDSAAVKWLGNFLRNSSGGVVIVSHDESLLENACDAIVEVRGRKLHHYSGTYSQFLKTRTMREAQAAATAASQQEEIARLEEFIARFGAKASKASQAQSRMKMLEKLKENAVEAPAAASALGAGDYKKVALRLPRSPPCNQEVLILKGAAVGWGQPGEGRAPLLSGIDLTIKKGQRILVLGPNGAGKSTFIKSLAGNVALWGGTRRVGDGVKMAYFSQDLAQDLPLQQTGLDYVMEKARQNDPSITLEKCRAALGALGLQGSMPLAKIGVLSGGEKARVALAAFALVPCNVLLLDEASNHLDAATISVLTGALQEFQGAIVAITHNQSFANSLNATHILRVADGSAVLSSNLGLSDADFDHRPLSAGGSSKLAAPAAAPERALSAAAAAAAAAALSSGTYGGQPASGKAAAASPVQQASGQRPVSGGNSSGGGGGAVASAGKKKRTTLAYSEQIEYKKLTKEVATLTTQRDAVAKQVATMGVGKGAAGFKQLEAATQELARLSNLVEEKELRWLELAEIAGDI